MTAPAGVLVSLILPNKNNDRVLDLFLERLAAHTTLPDYELIAIDDGSTDRSRQILRRWERCGRLREMTVIEKPGTGIVETLNLGLERARGEIVVRLDGDATIETRGWLEKMIGLLRTDERVGVVTGRVVFDNGRVHSYGINLVCPEGVHDRGSRITEPAGHRTADHHVERVVDGTSPEGDVLTEVDAAGGCCTAFRRELAERIGGFDTAYSPVWVEDFDFALGARRAGHKVFYHPDVRVVHRVGLRNPRTAVSRKQLLLYRLRHRLGHAVPARAREAVARAGRLGVHDPAQQETLRRHYAHWERKWGWDPVNPDMQAIIERWGGTEVCWRYDEAMRAAGEEIARRYGHASPGRPA